MLKRFGAIVLAASCVAQPAWSNGGTAPPGGAPSQSAGALLGGGQPGMAIAPNFRLRLDAADPMVTDGRGMIRRRPFSSSMVDFYPSGDGFHLSTGARLDNRRRIDPAEAGARGTRLYAPKGFGPLRRGTGLKRFAPAMLAGFTENASESFSLGLEAGALMLRGDPDTRELRRAMRMTDRSRRFDQSARVNPLVQVAGTYRF